MKRLAILAVLLFTTLLPAQDKWEVDDIIEAGLVELGIEGVHVKVLPITAEMEAFLGYQREQLEGFIQGGGDYYIMYLKDMSKISTIRTVAHELIHLKQLREGKLLTTSDYKVYWNGELYDATHLTYHQRPWEEEAYNEGDTLKFKIKKHIRYAD